MTLRNKLGIILWCLYIILTPFYLFPSGQPQISDFIFILIVILFYRELINEINRYKFIRILGLLMLWIFSVNTVWSVVLGSSGVFKNNMFYVFNYLLALFCSSNIKSNRFLKATLYSMVASVILQIVLIPFSPQNDVFRQILFFNNPNQLGYWSLLSISILAIYFRYKAMNPLFQMLILSLLVFLSVLSLSKAAMVTVAGILFLMLFSQTKSYKYFAVTFLVLFAIVIGKDFKSTQGNFIGNAKYRIESIGKDEDDNIAGRGYDRITKYARYIILGAGEGAVGRFNTNDEIHSSLGTLLFSYGIIGFSLFCYLIVLIFRNTNIYFSLLFVTSLLYSLTHMGLRFSLFWVALIFFYNADIIRVIMFLNSPKFNLIRIFQKRYISFQNNI